MSSSEDQTGAVEIDGPYVEIRLIRHGQTQGYEADLGLTDLGRQQAVAKGGELARTLEDGERVRVLHAPIVRAAETAEVIHRELVRCEKDVKVEEPTVDPRFDNFRIWCDGEALDPTQAYAPYAAARDDSVRPRPPWYDEMDRFWSFMAAGEDPITHWLTQPVQHFESAAHAVRRFWHGIVGCARDAEPGLRVFVATHSGCIRAVAAAAFGYDPGEPENTEDARIALPVGGVRGQLTYRGRTVEVVAPTTTTPPWTSGADPRYGDTPPAG